MRNWKKAVKKHIFWCKRWNTLCMRRKEDRSTIERPENPKKYTIWCVIEVGRVWEIAKKWSENIYIDVKADTHLLWGGKEDGRALERPENQKEYNLMCCCLHWWRWQWWHGTATVHLPKNIIKHNEQEILLSMAMLVHSISCYTLPCILDMQLVWWKWCWRLSESPTVYKGRPT